MKSGFGETVVFNESFRYLTDKDAGAYTNVPAEFTCIAFLPEWSGQLIRLESTGTEPIYFDAVQIETRTKPAEGYDRGAGGWLSPRGAPSRTGKKWGPVRTSVRINLLGPPEAANRWKQVDEKVETALRLNGRVQLIAEGTPAWAPISAERYDEAARAKRARTAHRHGEIRRGDLRAGAPVSRQGRALGDLERGGYSAVLGEARPRMHGVFSGGGAGAEEYRSPGTHRERGHGRATAGGSWTRSSMRISWRPPSLFLRFHRYCFETPAWDVPLGQVEGHLFSRGVGTEIFSDESGFPYKNSEWFQPPPQCTPEVQKCMLGIALARAFSNGLAKISVFHAGGDDHPYGLIDEKGQPRAAYEIYSDYALLGTRADGGSM